VAKARLPGVPLPVGLAFEIAVASFEPPSVLRIEGLRQRLRPGPVGFGGHLHPDACRDEAGKDEAVSGPGIPDRPALAVEAPALHAAQRLFDPPAPGGTRGDIGRVGHGFGLARGQEPPVHRFFATRRGFLAQIDTGHGHRLAAGPAGLPRRAQREPAETDRQPRRAGRGHRAMANSATMPASRSATTVTRAAASTRPSPSP